MPNIDNDSEADKQARRAQKLEELKKQFENAKNEDSLEDKTDFKSM